MFWYGVKFICVIYIATALSVTVEGTSETNPLPAFYIVQTENAENITGPSKIYSIETYDLTNTTRSESVLQLSLLNHHLLPGDKLTFYDGNFTSVLKEYSETTKTPALSFFTTLPDAKVVFTANKSDNSTKWSFNFLYRAVPKDTDKECSYLFYGLRGNIDSTEPNRGSESCRYTVTVPLSRTILLIFDNLTIPVGERLLIWKTDILDLQPVKGNLIEVFTPADNGKLYFIQPDNDAAVTLEFNSTMQFQIRFLEHNQAIEEFGKSGEIAFSMRRRKRYFTLKYWITVPRGHVKLTVHDLYLPESDKISVYINGERERVRLFGNSTTLDTRTVVSDSNKLAVTYVHAPYRNESIGRFRMTYSTLDTAPKACNNSFPNARKSRLFSELYEGWEDEFFCKTGYGNRAAFNAFTVLCQGNRMWTYTKGGECRKICPSIDSLYDLASHDLYPANSLNSRHLDGDNVTFSCWLRSKKLSGHEVVTCTSSGNYSASPPYCTDNAPQSSNPNLVLILLFSSLAAFVLHDESQ